MKVVVFPEGPEGPVVFEPPREQDGRGWASYLLDEGTIASLGLPPITSLSTVHSEAIGTVRGIQWQRELGGASIFVCIRGAARQVAVDLRPQSATHLRHVSMDLTEVDGRGFFVPAGFGHGWQALTAGATMVRIGMGRQTSIEGASPEDPKLGIRWPISPILTVRKDRAWEPL